MKKKALGIALAAFFGVGGSARGEEVPARPFLRIETGMHAAMITQIDADAAGRFLVTGSYDKTVRVWDVASGQLLRILRPPIEDGNEGKIYAVAISPDGELVAAGGWTGWQWSETGSIYLFDRRSGNLLRSLSGQLDVVHDLVFSPDGSRLVAAVGSTGLRVFQMPDGKELGWHQAGFGNSSYGIAFAPDGRIATTSFDGKIRLYDRDLHLLASASAPGGMRPYGVSFSPDGRRIAVGYEDKPRVDVLDSSDLRSLYIPDAQSTNLSLENVAWSADGTVLYAAGKFDREGRSPIRRWADGGRSTFQDFTGPKDTIMSLQDLPEGRLAFSSADPAWGVLDATGSSVAGQGPDIADFRDMDDGFRVATGGAAVTFVYEKGKRPAHFTISERRLVLDPPQDSRLALPRTSIPGLEVTGWKHTREPKLNGQPLDLETYEIARSLAIASDGQSFLLGTEWYLSSFDRNGMERWSVRAPGVTWAVNLTGDGRLAVAAFGDGTIRWYRADNGEELLAFFPHADGRRWVLWTPSGYYDASVDGEDLIGWHVNNGSDREADFFSAWHFRDRFRRPEVIDLILETLDEDEALRRAGIQPREIQKEELPPVVTILDPADGTEVAALTVKVRVNVNSPSGKPVTRVWARVDGQPIESRAAEYVPADSQTLDSARDFERTLEVALPPGDHIIEAIAEIAGRFSTPARITVKRKTQAPPTARRLFALIVGVADYAKAEYKLSFADDDARAVATLLRGQGKSFATVEVRELVNKEAPLSALLEGLQWLVDSVGSEDTAVVFFAGHGVNFASHEGNIREYFFLPYDGDLAKPVVSMLSQGQLQGILSGLRGTVLLFLDTCRAGMVFGGSDDERRRRVDVTALLNSLIYSRRGLVVFSAAGERELSQEREDWGHGAFTKALLEALGGAADLNKSGEITIAELDIYLTERVQALTSKTQTPIQTRPPGVPIFTFIKVATP